MKPLEHQTAVTLAFLLGLYFGWYYTVAYIYYKDLRKSNGPLKSFLNACVWIIGVVSDWRYR